MQSESGNISAEENDKNERSHIALSRRSQKLPAKNPHLEPSKSYFATMSELIPATADVLARPDVIDFDDTLLHKLSIMWHDLRKCKCSEFCKHFGDALWVLVNGYKALILFGACSLLLFFMDEIQDYLLDQQKEAEQGFLFGQFWFWLIIIIISGIKALSGPASKSIITFCLTVLLNVYIKNVSNTALTFICFFLDWFIDIFISTCQVHFAAAKFSRSLFLLLRIWVQVVSVLHPICFVTWIVFQAGYYLPGGFAVRASVTFPFGMWSFLHILYKLQVCPCMFHRDPCRLSRFRWLLVVDDKYVSESNNVLEQWACIFDEYQKRQKPYSVLHGMLRVMHVCGVCNCCLSDGDKAETMDIDDLWDNEKHALLKTFFPAWLWVYTAEFVLMLDAVFLVPYSWFRYYGVMMIAAVTLCDIDRFFTIRYTLKWLNEGTSFDDTVKELLWFKIIKQPIGQLLGCVHVYLIWRDDVRQALFGPGDLEIAQKLMREQRNKRKAERSDFPSQVELPSKETGLVVNDAF